MIEEKFSTFLKENGYFDIRETGSEHGVIALERFCFTVGIVCQLNWVSRGYRYCYHTLLEAQSAMDDWEKTNYQSHPPGKWIKRRGKGEDLQRQSAPGHTQA